MLAVFLTALFLSACSKSEEESITSLSQLHEKGRIIGVNTSAPEEALVGNDFPEAEIRIYSDIISSYTDVANGKIDAYIHARMEMERAIKNGVAGVSLLDETYCENTVAVGLSRASPISDLKNKINQFLQELRDDGTLDDMYERWVVEGDETMPEIEMPENPKDTLRVGTTGTTMPFTYYIGDKLAGYDIELAMRFASWLGMDLEFKIYDWGGIFAAGQSGDVDCIMSNLYYTKEHEESIDFSDALFQVEVTAMVKEGIGSAPSGFFEQIAESFEKTFIREDRWKLLVQGCCTTLLITVLAVLFGTLLGFAVYLVCKKGGRVANNITRFCVWLVQGMPVVVFLMILYYIIFGKVTIPGTWVSVIGFTIIFAAGVYVELKTSIGTVEWGQTEAAYSLGFSDRKTFFSIVLPQALPHIMPSYTGQVTALIKGTAVVGYIAVQDLTKMGDIIRSRTYEAFFPLISVAVLYFVLAGILTFLVRRIGRLLDVKHRKRRKLLKGVKLHD